MTQRGSSGFDYEASSGRILNTTQNVERLRALWLGREVVSGDDLGPGDPGDFDFGAWHISCHLVAAGAMFRDAQGQLIWVEISHDPSEDLYYGSATYDAGGEIVTMPLDSAEGRTVLSRAELLGFVEGPSQGRISARSIADPADRFNGNPRQDYDEPIESTEEGGKVWEHWCTLRDLRPSCAIATSVLSAYVAVVAAVGDHFVAAVARGRREYGHPTQLTALLHAGFISDEAHQWRTQPYEIPSQAQLLFHEARPEDSVQAAAMLEWDGQPGYYMFPRKIDSWHSA